MASDAQHRVLARQNAGSRARGFEYRDATVGAQFEASVTLRGARGEQATGD
jgi:hypothetical protein